MLGTRCAACWRSTGGRGVRGVMHSFCGTREHYRRILGCGDFLFGVGGVVTFKRSAIAGLLPEIGIERAVLETDAPYLTPVPFRGKRNESAYVRYVCAKDGRTVQYGRATRGGSDRTQCAGDVRRLDFLLILPQNRSRPIRRRHHNRSLWPRHPELRFC